MPSPISNAPTSSSSLFPLASTSSARPLVCLVSLTILSAPFLLKSSFSVVPSTSFLLHLLLLGTTSLFSSSVLRISSISFNLLWICVFSDDDLIFLEAASETMGLQLLLAACKCSHQRGRLSEFHLCLGAWETLCRWIMLFWDGGLDISFNFNSILRTCTCVWVASYYVHVRSISDVLCNFVSSCSPDALGGWQCSCSSGW